ncbi:MAG: MotA/TolQ/ExbB proton channel family protein [Thermoguttaceae bacterium]
MIKPRRYLEAGCRSPLLWGAATAAAFYAALYTGLFGGDFFARYCAGHPVEYVETVLFFVGLAALALKGMQIGAQYRAMGRRLLGPIPSGGQPPADCQLLLARLRQTPPVVGGDYLLQRLEDGLEHVRRLGSADKLDEHLKHLADLEAERAHAGYGLVRLIIWAIPILGFLGTVIGITLAIANLRPTALEESMVDVTAGLGVAFDTTALALALSIILMFVQFYVDRAEKNLLDQVDRRVRAELVGRFVEVSGDPAGQAAAIRRISRAAIESLEAIVRRQAELWQAACKAHQAQWTEVQGALKRATENLAAVQEAIVQKTEILARAVDATAYMATMQEALSRSLAALAGAKNFEQTVMSLAAAIHLLNARLGELPADDRGQPSERVRRKSQAA